MLVPIYALFAGDLTNARRLLASPLLNSLKQIKRIRYPSYEIAGATAVDLAIVVDPLPGQVGQFSV